MKIDAIPGTEFQIGPFENLELSAEQKGNEWKFSGETLNGQEISLKEIQKSFLPHITEQLPIGDLKAKKTGVVIRVKTDKENKEVYDLELSSAIDAQWDFQLGLKGQFHLEKLLFKVEKSKNITFSVQAAPFSLGDLGINLDFIKDIQVKQTKLKIDYIDDHFFTYFKGGIQIKEFDFLAHFTQEFDKKTKKKWFQFFGELENNYSLADLGFFTKEIEKVIPNEVKDLTINKLSVEYNSLLEKFVFEAKIKDILHFDVNIGELKKIAVHECSFLFEVSKEETNVRIKGDLAINNTHFISNTRLSNTSGLSTEINNRDTIEINLKELTTSIFGDMAVWDLVPPYFQNLEIDTAYALFQTSPLLASLNLETKQLGDLFAGVGKLNGEDFGILTYLAPPDHIPFSQISSDLALLETLDFTGSYLILSSFASKHTKTAYLPQALKDKDFIDGATLCASLSLNPERIRNEEFREKMVFFRKKILDIQQVSIKATLGLDLSKITIDGYIGKIAFGGGVLELSKAGLSLSAMLDVTLFGTISFDLEKYIGIEKMSFSMHLKLHANGLMGYGIWEGSLGTQELKRMGNSLGELESSASQMLDDYDTSQNFIKHNEVFNSEVFQKIDLLPDLQIRKLGLILGIDWEGIPSFGCIGEFSLEGNQQKNWGIIAFLFDSTNPSQCLFDLKFPKETQKTLENVILNFGNFISESLGQDPESIKNQLHENDIFRLLHFDGFYQDQQKTKWVPLRAKVAATDVKIGDTYYDMGIMVQGKIGLLNNLLGSLFNLKISKKGIHGFGKLKKFIINLDDTDLFALEASKVPIKAKDDVLQQNLKIAQAEFEGPYISLDASFTNILEANLHGSAQITFLGNEQDIFYQISTQGICFKWSAQTPLGNLLFDVIVKSLTDFEATSNFDADFDIDSFSVNAKGIATIKLENNKLTATLAFQGEYFNPISKKDESLGYFNIVFEAPPVLVEIFTDIIETIKNQIIQVAGKIFEDIREAFAKMAEDIKKLATQIQSIVHAIDEQWHVSKKLEEGISEGKEAVRLIGESIDHIIKDIDTLGRELIDLQHQIEDVVRSIEEKTKELEDELNNALNKAGEFILQFVGDVNTLNISILREVKRGLDDEWRSAERERASHYRNRIRLERERNLINFIPHTAAITYHFTMEGANEARKLLLTPNIEIVNSILATVEVIDNEIENLKTQKVQAEESKNKKTELQRNKQEEQSRLIQNRQTQNDQIKENEERIKKETECLEEKKGEKQKMELELNNKRKELEKVIQNSSLVKEMTLLERNVTIHNKDLDAIGYESGSSSEIKIYRIDRELGTRDWFTEQKDVSSGDLTFKNADNQYLAIRDNKVTLVATFDEATKFTYNEDQKYLTSNKRNCLGFKSNHNPEIWVHDDMNTAGSYERITIDRKEQRTEIRYRVVCILNKDEHYIGYKKGRDPEHWVSTRLGSYEWFIERKELATGHLTYRNFGGHYLHIKDENLTPVDTIKDATKFVYDEENKLLRDVSDGACLGFKLDHEPDIWLHPDVNTVGSYELITFQDKNS